MDNPAGTTEPAGSAVFDEIRAACRDVAGRARQVEIVGSELERLAASLPVDELEVPGVEAEHHYLGHGDATVAYTLVLDAINFGSGYFPYLLPRDGLTGYFMVAHAVKDRFEEQGPFSAAELVGVSVEDCAEIFGQPLDHEARRELMGLFAQALEDLGRLVLAEYGGDFVALVEDAGRSAASLVEILARMPLFRDVAEYDGRTVPFYKRAQITAADLWLAFGGEGPGAIEDLDELTVFADNLVPHVLRLDGVLRYDEALADRIDRGEGLAPNSPEEIEIRACALHTVELLVEEFGRRGRELTAFQLDNFLWHHGQDPRYAQKPRHHTRTVYY